MKNRNWFWGLFLLFLAVFIIASQLGSFGEISVFSILGTALLLAIIIDSIIRLQYFGIFVPLAFLYMIFREPFDLHYFSFKTLLLVAVLISISFSIILPHRRKNKNIKICQKSSFNNTEENVDDNNPNIKVSFGSSSKYLRSDSLKSGDFTVSFGELEVFFDNVQLSPEGAEVFLDCSFGSLNLYLPKDWHVIDKLQATLGGVDNNRKFATTNENSPSLVLKGNVKFGSIEINYI